ncbi:hypothetical protein T05_9976 [Trichinella murrelli]|uniref:Uncharacterized protein n=1 Tax=Trichinella murrelli TaxID=144512 RepID=A0A0V0U037_9BILA|nr:hypothetical protein T05_9976 [Trichinella murrelli]
MKKRTSENKIDPLRQRIIRINEKSFQLSKLFQKIIIPPEFCCTQTEQMPLIFTKKYNKLVFFLQITKIDLSAPRLHNKKTKLKYKHLISLGISLDNQESYLYKLIRK